MKLREFYVANCSIENLRRLCRYLKIDPSTNGERKSLINWLIYAGYVEDRFQPGRMY